MDRFVIWIAQGFGLGRLPGAPGTFGSLAGLPLLAIFLLTGNAWVCVALALAGIAVSVWACGRAEVLLNRTDPPSVVLDEIVAMPLCFAAWICLESFHAGQLIGPDDLFKTDRWPMVIGIFAAFRFFDVIKPWPAQQSQRLPGGWGVTTDDLVAAVYVNLIVGLLLLIGIGR